MLAVIGCGNSNRSDDGVGVFVAQALQRRLQSNPRNGVRVFDAGTGGMDVMFQARGARRLIVVDAATSGAPPGAIFEVPGEELQRSHTPSFNLHDFRWDHALAAGRLIFREQFPTDIMVMLIEAECLDYGLALSAPVRAAAERVIARLSQVIDAHGQSGTQALGAPVSALQGEVLR
jgi:hydrogenase maturation protease